jgi:5-hydroxyisourate hydrolase-like protein (transthyretin family)
MPGSAKRGFTLRLFFVALMGLYAGGGGAQSRTPAKRETKPDLTRYEITGVVLNAVGGDPVPHCRLTPTLNDTRGFRGRQFPSPTNNSFDCDARGHFTVTVPSAGSWRLTASARGFVSQAFDEHQLYSSSIILTAEAPTKEIEFRISPEASIVGQVLDEAGEPIRNAQIMLQNVPPPSPGGPPPAGGTRAGGRTDDRGMYELPNLSPGDYRLSVHAQPWYAAAAQPSLDPSLDFAYPTTWFPGETDGALAETIVLHAGDTRQADFHLVPVLSTHLHILTPPRTNNGSNNGSNNVPVFPIVEPIGPGGRVGLSQITTRYDAQGQIDVGGLTPGLYEVRLAGANQDGHAALVEVGANTTRTLDLSSPARDMARITLRFDGLADVDSNSRSDRGGGVQVTLIDTDTQRGTFSSNSPEGRGREQRDKDTDRVIEVPPGRYEVVLQGRQNLFLTGLTAKGAETAGRYVTVGAGESTLTVHVASGRASLSGIATLEGKPAVGAMILLVPVTIEDPNSITILRQDQTNTDGSFDLTNTLPGQYILVAIDHGWKINWGDPSTLRRYLMQGVPIELKSSAIVKQNIAAQVP